MDRINKILLILLILPPREKDVERYLGTSLHSVCRFYGVCTKYRERQQSDVLCFRIMGGRAREAVG